MIKNQRNLRLKVLFNASVVLSGLRSPEGGSGKLLQFVRGEKINGKISEVILDEILKHYQKLEISKVEVENLSVNLFKQIISMPNKKITEIYKNKVIDEGDAHVLATCEEQKIKYLVTLDKKHLLILKGKIKGLNILTPGELITMLS